MTTRQVFRGRTLMEARRAAEESLGGGAVLLTTREVRRPGLAGLLGTCEVEVVAAPPDPPPRPPTPAPRPTTNLFARGAYAPGEARGAYASDEPRGTYASHETRGAHAPSEPRGAFASSEARESAMRPDVNALRAELRAELRAIKGAMNRPDRVTPEILTELAALRAAIEEATPEHLAGDAMGALLRARGLEGPAGTALARVMRHSDDDSSPAERLRIALADVVKVTPWPIAVQRRAVVGLVGPTGVGKTTTVAKLAAHARIAGHTVTLVSCDSFRVGAIDQLRRFASLLGSACLTASSRDELANIIETAETDFVFVDTAGRAPKTEGVESFLASETFANGALERHVLLCVPAALRAQDAEATVRSFERLHPTAIAVTKIDETSAPAGLVHAPVAAHLPVSVLCNGQGVPEHIAQATAAAIFDHVATRLTTRGAGT